jgi:hypothetical protein
LQEFLLRPSPAARVCSIIDLVIARGDLIDPSLEAAPEEGAFISRIKTLEPGERTCRLDGNNELLRDSCKKFARGSSYGQT